MIDKPDGKQWLGSMRVLTLAIILAVAYPISATVMDYLKNRYAIGGAVGNAPRVVQLVTGQHSGLNRDQILAIAKQAVKDKGELHDGVEFREPMPHKDGSWDVLVEIVPNANGGDRLILIDNRGKVTVYSHGI